MRPLFIIMKYLSLSDYLKNAYGCKIYKLSLDGGFTCPNRDGKIDTRGCIFCSGYGSGDFSEDRSLSITDQIERAKSKVSGKIKDGKYIAYFQAFTNTYAPVNLLREKYMEAINNPDIAILSIATRPDCLSEEVLDLLSQLNEIKPVWIELGLQTIHERTAEYIRRGYSLSVYDEAVKALKDRNIYIITHVILGLPYENEKMMLETVKYVCKMTDGIKLQLLHVIKGTDLEKEYLSGKFECMSLDEYVNLIEKCVRVIPNNIAIHRLTGDGDKKTLVAPLWSADKKFVLNSISKKLRES